MVCRHGRRLRCCRTAPSRSTSGVMWPDGIVLKAAVLAMKFSAIGKIAKGSKGWDDFIKKNPGRVVKK